MLVDFAEARNRCMHASKNEIIFWIDCDDEIVGKPEIFRDFIDQAFCPPGRIGCIFLIYDYAQDKHGFSILQHWRERVFNKELYNWKGCVHETPIFREGAQPTFLARDPKFPVYIRHRRNPKTGQVSDWRNWGILNCTLRDQRNPDPRYHFYFANANFGLRRFNEALQ